MQKHLSAQPRSDTHSQGVATLVTVLIVGSLGAAITTGLLLLGVGGTKTTTMLEQSFHARALVNACAEEALEQIRLSSSFAGTGSLPFPNGSCTYTVTNDGGTNRTVTVSSTVNTVIRRSRLRLDQINPTIRIIFWQEVGEL